MSRLLPEVKIEVIEDLKFPKEWISNKKKDQLCLYVVPGSIILRKYPDNN